MNVLLAHDAAADHAVTEQRFFARGKKPVLVLEISERTTPEEPAVDHRFHTPSPFSTTHVDVSE